LIKKALAKEFGFKNVSVRGARGTAYGWVIIRIKAKKPDDCQCRSSIWPSVCGVCMSCHGKRLRIEQRAWGILKMTGLEEKLDIYYTDMGEKRKECIVEVELN